ncbi:nuclear transport factor 2 family protein [Saccharothrix variisporea]|uniref:Ketosteroid isomerase-like protein n=1 Tax=Saccharothrix variisporea TaxID=543527 RepID=A0A495X566_9PSEU|nr:nuclear transport factor 2 family protein [Saccharothrix variisporea]RKT69092.1 ketosteroid isomerase-like protein [Saccharothrix variisporea]
MSPRELFERLVSGIARRDFATLADLYADDAVVVTPMRPQRLEGKAALLEFFAGAARLPLELAQENVVVHETVDPEVVVVEWDWVGRVTTTGSTFRVPNVQVLRARDGLIVETRDYHDHHTIASALGEVPA